MVQPSEETSKSKHHNDREVAGALRRPIVGMSEANNSREIYKMVRPSEETLNTLFDVFQDWQDHLRFVDFEEIDKKYQETLNDGEDE